MNAWTCPRCGRSFGRENQWLACRPAASVSTTVAGRLPSQAAIADAVLSFLADLGPTVVEGVGKRVMIKRSRTFAELIFRREDVELAFVVSRTIDSPRIVRTLAMTSRRIAHVVRLTGSDLDGELQAWLAEAWESSPG